MAVSVPLRFPVSGRADEFFLLELSSNGSKPLDVSLRGSEGSAVFATKLRQRRIAETRASSGHCSGEEWEQILVSTLVDQKQVPDLEIRADIDPANEAVTLSFRKNIQGITQRLGSIKLDQNDDEQVNPFGWCLAALAERARLREDLDNRSAQVSQLTDSVNELKDQLQELISAKDQDESQMLEKFRDLLNEKKVKIREQQRLLAAASADPSMVAANASTVADTSVKAEAEGGEARSKPKRAPRTSRPSKRKAPAAATRGSSDEDSIKMEVDEDEDTAALRQASDDEQRQTTDSNETQGDVTASEDEASPPPKAAGQGKRNAATGAGRATRAQAKGSASRAPPAREPASPLPADDGETLPTKRELPFMRHRKAVAATPQAAEAGDETESDDEL